MDIFAVVLLLVGVDDTVLFGSACKTVGISDVVAQPRSFATPVGGLVGFPSVGTATCETYGLETHRFEGHIAGQDDEISP